MNMDSMSTVSDHIRGLVETAQRQLRRTTKTLEDKTIPHILPSKRNAALAFVRGAERGKIFSATALFDIDSLIIQLGREAESGTHQGWEGDEGHINGGWPVTYYDSRASALLAGADALHQLRDAIANCLDALQSYEVASSLMSNQ